MASTNMTPALLYAVALSFLIAAACIAPPTESYSKVGVPTAFISWRFRKRHINNGMLSAQMTICTTREEWIYYFAIHLLSNYHATKPRAHGCMFARQQFPFHVSFTSCFPTLYPSKQLQLFPAHGNSCRASSLTRLVYFAGRS